MAAVGVIAAACGGGSAPTDGPTGPLVAAVASFDVSTVRAERFVVGLFTSERAEIGLGTVTLDFEYLGTSGNSDDGAEALEGPRAEPARFLAIPGSAPAAGDQPTADPPPGVRGVYGTEPIILPAAGVWEVVDERNAPMSDTIVTVRITQDAPRFVDPQTLEVKTRIGFVDLGVTFPSWGGRFDQVF